MGIASNMAVSLFPLIATAFLYFVVTGYLRAKKDPGEIPSIPSNVPFIGHLINLMRHRMRYYVKLRTKYPFPIFSLKLLGKRMYIVSSPDLVVTIQRNWKSLQFSPFASMAVCRLCRLSPQASRAITTNASLEKGEWGLYYEAMKGIHAATAPGGGLEHMNRIMIANVSTSFNSLKTGTLPIRLNILSWLRHGITLATSEAVYGPANPLRNRTVEDGFWAFEDDITMLLVNFWPAVTARKGHKGRQVCVEAFKQYLANKDYENGSGLIKARVGACLNYAVSDDDIARFEVSGVMGLLENTVPTAFWMLTHVFSIPSLLANIRLELKEILQTTEKVDGTVCRTLDVTAMKEKCPLLVSTFQETLRHHACGASTREVLRDTTLKSEYTLKEGSIIQIPSSVIHEDPAVWGPTVAEFDPRRFLKRDNKDPGEYKAHPGAFRAFGGGTTLCPGRHFASNEVMCIVAIFAMGCDLEPVGGEWRLPPPKTPNLATAISFPAVDIEVFMKPREGFEDGSWAFHLAEPKL